MSSLIGVVGFFTFIAFGIAQLIAGFAGIEVGLGYGWAWVALIAAIGFRFTLPITIGAFFGAMNVWGWHWALAALFTAPGLILIIPGTFAAIFAMVKR